jgi:hypothetical protein
MTLLIRDIGKIPYSCSYNNNNSNNNNYPQSSSSWHAGDTNTNRHVSTSLKAIMKNCGISSIEEKARSLLSRNHLLNLIHNISEYGAKRNMDIDTFVTILLELLDTPEKVSTILYYNKFQSITPMNSRLIQFFNSNKLTSRELFESLIIYKYI